MSFKKGTHGGNNFEQPHTVNYIYRQNLSIINIGAVFSVVRN